MKDKLFLTTKNIIPMFMLVTLFAVLPVPLGDTISSINPSNIDIGMSTRGYAQEGARNARGALINAPRSAADQAIIDASGESGAQVAKGKGKTVVESVGSKGGGLETPCSYFAAETWFAGCLTPLIIPFGGTLLSFGAAILDFFLALTVNTDLLTAPYIDSIWITMRDLANMTFILGMISIGFMMIFGGAIGDWKKVLMRLIIVALLINFSLFFTRVVIDAGNIVGLVFYDKISNLVGGRTNSMVDGRFAPGSTNGSGGGSLEVVSVSEGLVTPLRLDEMMSVKTINDLSDNGNNSSFLFMFNVVFIVIAIAGCYSFSYAGFMFLSRTVTLIILSLVSPLAFVTFFLPGLDKLGRKWLNVLFNTSFCLAAYVFLIYLLMLIVNSGFQTGPIESANGDFITTAIRILVLISMIIGILVLANKQAKKMCESGGGVGSFVMKAGKTLALGAAGGAALGVGAMALRNTVGRLGGSLATKGMKERGGKTGFDGALNRTLYNLGDVAKNAKFGGRNSLTDAQKKAEKKVADRAKKFGIDSDVFNKDTGDVETSKTQYQKDLASSKGVMGWMTGGKVLSPRIAAARRLEDAEKLKEANKGSNKLEKATAEEKSEVNKATEKTNSKLMTIEQQEKNALEAELKLAKGKGINVNIVESDSIEQAIHGGDVSAIEATHDSLDALKSIESQMKANSDSVPLLQEKLANAKTDMNAGNIDTETERAYANDTSGMSKEDHRARIVQEKTAKHDEIKGKLDGVDKENRDLQESLDKEQKRIDRDVEEIKQIIQKVSRHKERDQVKQELESEKVNIAGKYSVAKKAYGKAKNIEDRKENARLRAEAAKELKDQDGDSSASSSTKKSDDKET